VNRDELTLRKELSESKEWDFIRERLLNLCAEQSGNEPFCKDYVRGVLYAINRVDGWADTFYKELKKEQQRKGVTNE
jgi:hypothetical protein